MLPSLVARDIERGVREFVEHEFPLSSPFFTADARKDAEDGSGANEAANTASSGDGQGVKRSVLQDFLARPGSLVKGPWAEVKLPFRCATDSALPLTNLSYTSIVQGFVPYEHQLQAFRRLRWVSAHSTIVATGTGSGKTECFLYPILDYCLYCVATRKIAGIKAILLYPMNALAEDQARRLASLLWSLGHSGIRAALYVGDDTGSKREMGESFLISERAEIRKNPPDILLTNYKMLDFLLLRPEDQKLWQEDTLKTLRYLVVDELHTFDGAQGTDLSCLIRRLRDRLQLQNKLCCIGTSATIGSERSLKDLCSYASAVFATPFTAEAVVREDRLKSAEYLESFGTYVPCGVWPSEPIPPEYCHDLKTYLSKAVDSWFPSIAPELGFNGVDEPSEEACFKLGDRLPHLEGFRRLIGDLKGVQDLKELAVLWESRIAELHELPYPKEKRVEVIISLIDSLLALISAAKVRGPDGKPRPFLQVRCQLWLRELARATVTVSRKPQMHLAADLGAEHPLALPLVGCRECHQAAWGGVVKGSARAVDARVSADLTEFYRHWFDHHQNAKLFYPIQDYAEYQQLVSRRQGEFYLLCPGCKGLNELTERDAAEFFTQGAECPYCHSTERVAVWLPDLLTTRESQGELVKVIDTTCPLCGAPGALRIFGNRTPTLAAAALDDLHSSAFNRDHKVIAFADSVQDAAQRAAFIAARNYLNVTRHALQYGLRELIKLNSNLPLPLNDVLHRYSGAWVRYFTSLHQGEPDAEILGQAEFLATFVAPDMQWWRSYQDFKEKALQGPKFVAESAAQWSALFDCIKERLSWELLIEIGLRAGTGRTLLSIGALAGLVRVEKLRQAAQRLESALHAEFGKQEFDSTQVALFITGLMERLRSIGAFDPTDFNRLGLPRLERDFGGYLKTGNDFLYFNKSSVLPNYGRTYRPPSAVTLDKIKDKFTDTISATGSTLSWYEQWAQRCLKLSWTHTELRDLFAVTLKVLGESQLLNSLTRKGGEVLWLINPRNFYLSTNVSACRCTVCRRRYPLASELLKLCRTRPLPCLSRGCLGVLEESDDEAFSDQDAYAAAPVRVNAREHTALIDGQERGRLEHSFGSDKSYSWDLNLLTATPTLEMGIDIGTLSTVLLTSMPPAQANYLQRIGRAGRRDGNALALSVVGRYRHDQYFWDDPKEMLEGEVTTPGVFLKAVAVLERQLCAYALGRWVSSTKNTVKLASFNLKQAITAYNAYHDGHKPDSFPGAFIHFVELNQESLLAGFAQLFEDGENALSDEALATLRDFIAGSMEQKGELRPSLAVRLTSLLERARVQQEDWRRELSDLRSQISALKERPQDELNQKALEELELQLAAVQGLLNEQRDKNFFSYLTEEGLLPNYAFPEDGVQLDSVIIRRKERADKTAAETNPGSGGSAPSAAVQKTDPRAERNVEKFSFERPSASALTELAPNSIFYFNGVKLHVDQVKLDGDRSFDEWRFCANCAHMEKVSNPEARVEDRCPHCHSSGWADVGRRRRMLRISQLLAHADSRQDRIGEGDERRSRRYHSTRVLVDVDPSCVRYAWRLDDPALSFGFEFLERVAIREINFGEMGYGTTAFMVAGRSVPAEGFKICKCCGKIYKKRLNKGEFRHALNCRYRDSEVADTMFEEADNPWIEGLFLYRELRSEAIRLRLPVDQELDAGGAEKVTESLMAALYLGLRRYFKGNVDHLKLSVQEEISPEDERRLRYVVLYDTIPGGSGYLKELGRPDHTQSAWQNMQHMLRTAQLALSRCSCAEDPDKDGCYHCLYRYSDSAGRDLISRRLAEDVLGKLLKYPFTQYRQEQQLTQLSYGTQSVLEELFMKKLRSIRGFTLTYSPTVKSAQSYVLEVPLSERGQQKLTELCEGKRSFGSRFSWRLTLQEDVKGSGVYQPSRPDFTFTPVLETLLERHPALKAQVFTDGWRDHAAILAEDGVKRQSILNLGQRVFSLSWQEVRNYRTVGAAAEGSAATDKSQTFGQALLSGIKLNEARERFGKVFKDVTPSEAEALAHRYLSSNFSSLDWLVAWLQDPLGFAEDLKTALRFTAMGLKPCKDAQSAGEQCFFAAMLESEAKPPVHFAWQEDGCPYRLGYQLSNDRQHALSASLLFDDAALGDNPVRDERLHLQWRTYLQLSNALQFADTCRCGAVSAREEGCYAAEAMYCATPARLREDSDELYDDHAWQVLFDDVGADEEFFAHILPLLESLRRAGVRAPADYGLEGIGSGAPLSESTGCMWQVGGKELYLFSREDLLVDEAQVRDTAQKAGALLYFADDENSCESIKKELEA
ncbi:MAG: DEAD/DEAH box helicase [Succinivibrio sp.]|nr:DEAD/DEAH box helicase [Succinivibrio sp.]